MFCRRSLARLFGPTACLEGLVIPPDCFLRVSFGDEGGDRLCSNRDEPIEVFYQRVEQGLKQGELTCQGLNPQLAMGSACQACEVLE